jgi:hypothetical protein
MIVTEVIMKMQYVICLWLWAGRIAKYSTARKVMRKKWRLFLMVLFKE